MLNRASDQINNFFGATKVTKSQDIGVQASNGALDIHQRGILFKQYFTSKVDVLKDLSENPAKFISDEFKKNQETAIGEVKSGEIDVFAYIGALFDLAGEEFKKIFTELNNIPRLEGFIFGAINSATSLWSSVFKSVLIKTSKEPNADELKAAFDNSLYMMQDLTSLPNKVQLCLEVAMSDPNLTADQIINKILEKDEVDYFNDFGRKDVAHEMINYHPESKMPNFNSEILSQDKRFSDLRDRFQEASKEHPEILEYRGCPGFSTIKPFHNLLKEILNQYFFQFFDDLVKTI